MKQKIPRVNPIKKSMYYALFIGLAVSLSYVSDYFLAFHPRPSLNIFPLLLLISALVLGPLWALRHYRNTHLSGFISAGQAFLFSLNTIFFASLVASFCLLLVNEFSTVTYQEAMALKITIALEGAEEASNGEIPLDDLVGLIRSLPTSSLISGVISSNTFIFGIPVGIIGAIFLKKSPNTNTL